MWQHDLMNVAARQHGVIGQHQLDAFAPSRSAARHEVAKPQWEAIGPTTFRSSGSPETDLQKLMAAVLDAGPGAVASHPSSASLWSVPGFDLLPSHVTLMRATTTRRPGSGVRHEARHLAADQVTVLHGIPVTRPERVPFDLANIGVSGARIERIVDRLWSDRLVSGPSLRRVKRSLPLRGFRGTALMREILAERGDDWIPPASGLESRTMELLNQNGIHGYERQVDLGANEWIGRVDFVNRDRRIIVEVQSDRHHAALSSRRDDALRFERFRQAGFMVIEVWEDEVWHRPSDWLERMHHAERTHRPKRTHRHNCQ